MAEEQAPVLADGECENPQDSVESEVKKTDVREDESQTIKSDMPESTTAEENAQNVASPAVDQESEETGAETGDTDTGKEDNEAKTLQDANEATGGPGQEPETIKDSNSEKTQDISLSEEKAAETESPKEETAGAQAKENDAHSKSKEDKSPSAKDGAKGEGGAKAGSAIKDNTAKASKDATREKEKSAAADLPRSRTMPKSYGRASKKDIAEKFGGVATSGVRVQRSTSTGANTVKNMLLEWCRAKTRGREGVDIQNFSSSWSDGLAFCALILAFFPEAFDYDSLDPKNRRQNFQLAFSTAETMADCPPLLDVEDMVRMKVPDAKCVYTYVQELYRSLVAKGLVKTKKA